MARLLWREADTEDQATTTKEQKAGSQGQADAGVSVDYRDILRENLEQLLEGAREVLRWAEVDALRLAIKNARERDVPIEQAMPGLLPRAQGFGERILVLLADANDQAPDIVPELEARIQECLAV